ncbi:hypothetical protein BD779DRAFT_1800146 [Infundibulicybe gibba]|nr:hypothetical protein BD779DRAFT_1800146 [Infundibulicybe gibba]
MSGPTKNVLLVGFGAVGVICELLPYPQELNNKYSILLLPVDSLILKRSGLVNVTSVARSNYEIVQSQGIDIKSREYGNIDGWRPDRLVKSVSDAADPIPDVKTTSSILAPLLSTPYIEKYPQPTYVLLQNGLNVEVDFHAYWYRLLAPNVVEHTLFDRLILGVYRHNDYTTTVNTPEEESILKDIGHILRAGVATSDRPGDPAHEVQKEPPECRLLFICDATNHPLTALFRPPPPPGMSYSPFVAPATAEYIEKYTLPTIRHFTGGALGFPDTADGLPSSALEEAIDGNFYVGPDSSHTASMLLDARMGRPIEVEVILGEAVRMARERGVEVPRVEVLYALLLVVQNQILRQSQSSSN